MKKIKFPKEFWKDVADEKLKQNIKDIEKELQHYYKTKIIRCHICKKNFVNGIDSITKKKSQYLWVSDCEHNKGMGVMIG